ncbi:sodium-dependent phosphate transport protein 2B-like [Sycon ciliatum]|uniref:sodium-dependent phosphate transport protein 2B-like n=1 Tax=Sycon ciliatum TaxID=27933 RepID=UPI0031F6820C
MAESRDDSSSSSSSSSQQDVENDGNNENRIKFRDLPAKKKVKVASRTVALLVGLLGLLYIFVCSLSLMGSAFQLLGGKQAGETLSNSSLFNNPVAALVLGVLVTVLLQSSSTTTSIIISMTASEILQVKQAIFMVMGANIGTSVTNTIVSMTQITSRDEFRLAFSGATVHDVFNFLTALTLLPVEAVSGYLLHLSTAIVDSWHLDSSNKGTQQELLKAITKPLTNRVVQIDKKPLQLIAEGKLNATDAQLLKQYCSSFTRRLDNCTVTAVLSTGPPAVANVSNVTTSPTIASEAVTVATSAVQDSLTNYTLNALDETCLREEQVPCDYLFHGSSLPESAVGAILLVWSLVMLCVSLVLMVKVLTRLLRGQLSKSAKSTVNADFPGRAAVLTGYFAILIGAGLTMLVQSSSVFTSSLTPLVGLGIIDLERMYPLTLGANIGTTITGMLAGLASSNVELAMKVAMAHLFFNITGILLFYPIPPLRRIPLRAARFLGATTAKYRWFAIAYLIILFLVCPGIIFGLSLAGWRVLLGVGLPILIAICLIVAINVLQKKHPHVLPKQLRSWSFLPEWLKSLKPYDRVFRETARQCRCCRDQGYDTEEGSSYENSTSSTPAEDDHKLGLSRQTTVTLCTESSV